MTDRVAAIWTAVDLLTKVRKVDVVRVGDADWLEDLADPMSGLRVCDVAAYRAATRRIGDELSLWDQATQALATGMDEGGGSPLRERSPADLALMEIRGIIRDTTRMELEKRAVKTRYTTHGRPADFNQNEIRSLASRVIADSEPDLEWWEYRFAQWARLLQTYLHAHEHQPKSVRLRNSPCPACRTRQITIESDNGPIVVPAILIDFRDGMVRAAECTACGATWFRGPDLEALAEELCNPPRSQEMTA